MASQATIKWAATMVLVALGYLVYKYLLKTPTPAAPASSGKKKHKKKSGKKKKAGDSSAAATQSDKEGSAMEKEEPAKEIATAQPTVALSDFLVDDGSDSSDDEDGLSAAQILAQKHFGAAAMGGAHRMAPASKPTFQFEEGQRVLAQYQNQREWFNGTIIKVQRGNLYSVQYDDGEVETKVPLERLRLTNGEAPWSEGDGMDSSSSDSNGTRAEDEWEVVKVPAKVKGQRPPPPVSAEEAATGLTKKQRESRRRKERLREQKELLRSEAQEGGLHARWGGTKNKWIAPSK
ncbi:hypothetical protein ACHHYP_07783 [Achlya hypogyna]|uniref:Tudor domain-containing protein n=1 Tax=Achlya hypogyna TaxID=1202772 RepID=A0A1V9YQX5_ACHHY|nr:hypothetical protein ACHHYP_07783 [Achlya hypogyna]